MLRNLALMGLCTATLLTFGCRNDQTFTPTDLAQKPVGDMGMNNNGGDMSVQKMYTDAKIHDIDTAKKANQAVKVSGAIATTIVAFFKANKGTVCKYEVFVQDPTCTTGPCGIVVEVTGGAVSGGTCAKANMSGTPLANVKQGDSLDISGTTDTFADSTAPKTVVQNSITADTVTVNSSNNTLPAAVVITDTVPSMFVSHTGAGWQMYEGMRVTLSNVTIDQLGMASDKDGGMFATGDFTTSPGEANWGSTFDFLYRYQLGGDAGAFPATGKTYKSITGVVSTLFGGDLLPTGASDFVQ